MLKDLRVHTTLPPTDLARAQPWYSEKLGLDPDEKQASGLTYRCKDSQFVIYPGTEAGSGRTRWGGR